ncbi:hypothetical protein CWB99_17460 [Pseudoalteromonas rubra]|uniref:Uncharacterized protein n=1 Tax=Pseudoalteromonas rubra TaxID=43658 RepID=A0A5S3WIL6_9GAMM|nr:hypothetical protein [Pseudoalteromonas rubra]TMP26885.1 hypothetical protein CWB99_17460 [Pseudoalteromonas rubra]TMP33730.1 hypothetical protein CWC00_09485 [Pseudoalteromonas rubra]
MKLASSLVVTGIIAMSVWGIALLQPMPVQALSSAQPQTVTQKQSSLKATRTNVATEATAQQQGTLMVALDTLVISGNTATLPTDKVQQLWQDFNTNTALNSRLIKQPLAVYVLYKDFSANFAQATITIGYSIDALSSAEDTVTLDAARYEPLLSRKKHSVQDIALAWQEIDYRRPINRVVEIHYLSDHSTITSSELLVGYGE